MMAKRVPEGPPPEPVVQKLRVEYAKRGRMRFTSTRDFQRAVERAVRRAAVPMAYSAGFHPHPRISYANAAPTGTASEAEYVELSVTRRIDPDWLVGVLDQALPEGLDVLRAVEAQPGALADRLTASRWRITFPDTPSTALAAPVRAFLERDRVEVTRLMKRGPRRLDVREPVLDAVVSESDGDAVIEVTIRHTTPTIRPEEVLKALAEVGGAALPRALSTRVAQGTLIDEGDLRDPLAD
jgi:radical SAM-linked protein